MRGAGWGRGMTTEAFIAAFIFVAFGVTFGVTVYLFIIKSEEMTRKSLLKELRRIQKALNIVVDKVSNGADEYDECISIHTDCIIRDLEHIFNVADALIKHDRFADLVNTADNQ